MKADYTDFIGVFSDVFPEGFCGHLISEFDRLAETGVGYNRKQGENAEADIKNDYAMNLNGKKII